MSGGTKSNAILSLRQICKRFNTGNIVSNILQDIDFTVMRGEMVAIIGPSGSGKSTMLHLAGLLDIPDSGSVEIDGKNCTTYSENAKTAMRCEYIGFIYQSHHLLPEFTVAENVMIPQLIARVDKPIAQKKAFLLLEEVGLAKYANKFVTDLSGGEQQRVAIARSIVNNPAIILADEPTGNLDHDNSFVILNLLLEAAARHNSAVVMVTHNLELIKHVDRALKLESHSLVSL